ncbi:Trp family transcriptional regulator [Patescibacteria group bacterium]|nr:Trp family transcriptional regulator [Patescibacteria group bacterium]MCL5091814.1 Trp family transcriptional regulator [Patescibacteria group bacterium]
MVYVSKKKLPDQIWEKIYQVFLKVMDSSVNAGKFHECVDEIFSPSEKIMIAKRITVIYLLVKGVDPPIIADTVKVSTATVAKFALLSFQPNSRLAELMRSLLKKEKLANFFENLAVDLLVRPGVKHGNYRRFWEHEKHKRFRNATGL